MLSQLLELSSFDHTFAHNIIIVNVCASDVPSIKFELQMVIYAGLATFDDESCYGLTVE